MKALKEKRPSLRSILRGGLVILSLLALAFAVVACNTAGTEDDDETTGSTPPVESSGPKETVPEVVSIRVVTQPSGAYSYQGGEPKVDGISIEVLWNDSAELKTYSAAQLAANNFYVDPGYCDIPGLGAAAGTFYIMHKGSTAKSQPVTLPGVIALESITADGTPNVYSDERPNFTGKLTLTGRYVYDASTPTTTCATAPAVGTTGTTKIETNPIVVNTFYPKFDMTGIQATNQVTFSVGNNGATTVNTVVKAVTVNYFQVSGVAFDHWTDDTPPVVYDINTGLSRAASGVTAAQSATALAAIVANAWFRVEYVDQNGTGDVKTISYSAFKANVDYAREQHAITAPASLEQIFYRTNGVRDETVTTGQLVETTEILAWDDTQSVSGNPEWTFFMEYVPKEYITSKNSYIAKFDMNIPVWTFDGDISVSRKPNYNTDILVEWPSTDVMPMDIDLLNSIKDRWTLAGVYRLGSQTRNGPALAFLSSMFQNGTTLRGTQNGVNYAGQSGGIALQAGELSGQIVQKTADGEASYTIWEYGYNLPLIYRGGSDEETVVINIEYSDY